MKGIPSLTASLKKNQSVVEALAATTQKELTSLLNQIDRLLEFAAHLQESWEDRQATEEELSRDASSLAGELEAETREKSKLETTDSTQRQVLEEAKAEREKLQEEVTTAEKTLEELEDQLRTLDRTLREQDKALVKVEELLNRVDEKHTHQLENLETKASEALGEAELLDAKYKALRYLVQEKIITSPEAKVALELKGKETTTIDHLQKTTFIGRFKVREILEQMIEHKIVKFDRGSGQVKVLKPIDL
ncbi:MAG: hypothetical protein ACXACF_03850 [Candidatus Hermodarchaeia archaeon]|jgi:chromosome segregation ATPase